uniref:Uncharacterized protein n=1 Tax=Fagus sylvatica TaxID=28930 RepID=A0A2N9GHY8_FAGSY
MTTSEKYSFLEVLEGVECLMAMLQTSHVDGYASNISRCVKLKERKIIEMAKKPLRTRVVTLGFSSQQAPAHKKGSSSQQAPTHEEQAHHEPLDVEEQLAINAAVSVKEWTLQKLSKMWRDRKWRMKGDKFKKNGNPTHVVAAAPPHVDKVDFATLVTYWYSKDGQKEERGVNVPIERAELYEKFYTHKDGTPVNDDAAKNIQRMNELMSDPSTQLDCTSSSGSIAWAPNDVYSQVKGPEHSGRVRGLGFGPTPSGRNTKTKIMGLRIRSVEEDPKYQEMKNELDSLKAQVANMAQFLQQNAQHFPQGNFGVPDQQSPIGQRSSVASHQSKNLREF